MKDRREQILERLMVLLATVPTVKVIMRNVVRNRGELPLEERPAISLLDADEVARGPSQTQQRGRLVAGSVTTIVEMTPEIFVVMDARKQENKLIGEDMNAMRMLILQLIFNDIGLADIMGAHAQRRYVGCQTDMGQNREMEGQMNIQIAFTYALLPQDL
jgi:hypothetical protein